MKPLLERITIPISTEKNVTIFIDAGNIITLLPSIDDLLESDIQAYLNLLQKKINQIETKGLLSKIQSFTKHCAYALQLIIKHRKTAKITRLSQYNPSALTIITQTLSEPVAVTEIHLDGDIVSKLSEHALHEPFFRIHSINVKYVMLLWREDLTLFLNIIKFALDKWRSFMYVTTIVYTLFGIISYFAPETFVLTLPIPIVTTILTIIINLLKR